MIEEKSLQKSPDCKEYYRELYTKCGEILTTSFEADNNSYHCINHHFILDLEKWIKVLNNRPEVELLEMALREYQYALLALVQGQYRQAFMALRLFLELTLSVVHFSANELNFRIWQRNQGDIKWNNLINLETGVFSKSFIEAFYEDLADEAPHYYAIAGNVYRECSEYVHGNAYTHGILSDKLEFINDVFFDWHKKAKSIRLVVSFALSVRYLNFLSQHDKELIEPIIIDELGHISVIRDFFGGVTEIK